MLFGLFAILLCQLSGEAVVRGLGLPVPGPVAGIVLLFCGLALADRRRGAGAGAAHGSAPVGGAADGLLSYLGLLFVPAGVGIAQSTGLIARNGLPILLVLVLSTVATLLVTVFAFLLVRRLQGRSGRAGEGGA